MAANCTPYIDNFTYQFVDFTNRYRHFVAIFQQKSIDWSKGRHCGRSSLGWGSCNCRTHFTFSEKETVETSKSRAIIPPSWYIRV